MYREQNDNAATRTEWRPYTSPVDQDAGALSLDTALRLGVLMLAAYGLTVVGGGVVLLAWPRHLWLFAVAGVILTVGAAAYGVLVTSATARGWKAHQNRQAAAHAAYLAMMSEPKTQAFTAQRSQVAADLLPILVGLRAGGMTRDKARAALAAAGLTLSNDSWALAGQNLTRTPVAGRVTAASFPEED